MKISENKVVANISKLTVKYSLIFLWLFCLHLPLYLVDAKLDGYHARNELFIRALHLCCKEF